MMWPSVVRRGASLACALFVTAGWARAADSVLTDFSANHVSLRTQSEANYTGAVVDSSGVVSDSATAAQLTLPHPPLRNDVAATAVKVPASGAVKDEAKGVGTVTLQFGVALAPDLLTFGYRGFGSAVSSKDSTGVNADASVKIVDRTSFFIDSNFGPTPAPPGTYVGYIRFDGLRPLNAGESLVTTFTVSGATTVLPPPGSGPISLPMITGHGYGIEGDYSLHVPFGTDPQYDLEMNARVYRLLVGDFNFDGTVDFTDLLILAQHYGQQGAYPQGDADQNGVVDFKDLLALAQNYGHTNIPQLQSAAVPEPGVVGVLAAGTILAFRRHRN